VEVTVSMLKRLKRLANKPNWQNLRHLKPISRQFGMDRGTPIDRIYIEQFISMYKQDIRGVICEIAEDTYSKKFGDFEKITKFEVLHYNNDNTKATIVGDLSEIDKLPAGQIDCFILTQTLNFIEDIQLAIKGIHSMLAKNGTALITVAGLCQISRYDMDRWGDYWRFTDLSLQRSLAKIFGDENVTIETFGNVLSATALLQGLSAEELTQQELDYKDQDYQIIIAARVVKNETPN